MAKQTTKKSKDPYAKREATKYDTPVASREWILQTLDEAHGPLSHRQLCEHFNLVDVELCEGLRRRLRAMERDGQIYSNRRQAYASISTLELIRGRIQGHKDGFGFLIPDDGSTDIYLPYRQMRKVFDGDEALVRITPDGPKGRRDGRIVEVIGRHTTQLVGRYFNKDGVNFVKPENPRITQDILITAESALKPCDNQFVIVDITQYPDRQLPAMGKISEILGDHMAPGMEISVAIRAHQLPHQWSEAVKNEALAVEPHVDEASKQHRIDLRDSPFVTIDGEDARDFDDAVYCQKKKSGGWRLYVAIADVSHYVRPDSAIDQEAQTRCTSVYFPDFVLPMLPEALSNGLCSLNPHTDRLAMVCEMTISAQGRISGYQFYEALIHSHARLTYTDVHTMIDSKQAKKVREPLRQQHTQAVLNNLDQLHLLYTALRALRDKRGAIDFDTVETRILFDYQRKIEQIIPVTRNDAHRLIEECMLCANVCAARFLEKHDLDGLYRVHEGPKEKKLDNLRQFLTELGLSLGAGNASKLKPQHYQQLAEQIAGRVDEKIIQMVMLRSLSQAVYQTDNKGHFGLAYPSYTHFTSPIRRYPDLLTHRAIRHIIRSRKPSDVVQRVKGAKILAKKAIYPYQNKDIQQLGEQASMAERRADEATRDVTSWLKCEYLQNHLGDTFAGIITAVTNFGVFVELLDLYTEGLVHITALPSDYYRYEAAHQRLIGERSRQTFCLGDELHVRVAAVNLDERRIDFELLDAATQKPQRRKKSSSKKKKAPEKSKRSRKKPS